MARFEVVAVYPSGRRFPIGAHGGAMYDRFMQAELHRALAAATYSDETYEVDMYYVGADGCNHWRPNIDGAEDLGYPPEEIESCRAHARELVARRQRQEVPQ